VRECCRSPASTTRAEQIEGGKRKRRRCVPGLIISTDARRGANDKTHAIYPLMREAPVFPSLSLSLAVDAPNKKWPDIIMIISAPGDCL